MIICVKNVLCFEICAILFYFLDAEIVFSFFAH
jgi:hypothetical protein